MTDEEFGSFNTYLWGLVDDHLESCFIRQKGGIKG
jgi:3-methyladenine DNA glycosylase Tag